MITGAHQRGHRKKQNAALKECQFSDFFFIIIERPHSGAKTGIISPNTAVRRLALLIKMIMYQTYARISNIRNILDKANRKYFDELDFEHDSGTAEGQIAQLMTSASNCLDGALFLLKNNGCNHE
ncbi:MAG: hypothetical protein HQK96_06140 [Nitrospirae bacterium]|nr:hypothetical protein [Nitrospirota bacterium]